MAPPTSTPDILPANAHLIGVGMQLIFSGAYYVYFPQCVVILRRKVRDGMSLVLPVVCGIFFVLTTITFITEMVRAFNAFSAKDATPEGRPNPVAFYRNGASALSLVKNSIVVTSAIVSDAVIVYRTFIVWNCNYFVIIIPVLTFLASAGMGIWSTYTLSQTAKGDLLILADVTVRVRYFFVLTFCVTLMCAALICWRIWRISFKRRSGFSDRGPLTHIISVMVESAGLYCAYLCALIITDCIGSNVFFIFLDATTPVVAIVYSMLIVRVHAPRENASTPLPSSMSFGHTTQRSAMRHQSSLGVEINLERVVHTDLPSPRAAYMPHPYAMDEDKDKGQAF